MLRSRPYGVLFPSLTVDKPSTKRCFLQKRIVIAAVMKGRYSQWATST